MFGLDNVLWDTIRDPAKGYLNDLGEFTAEAFSHFIKDQSGIQQKAVGVDGKDWCG